MEDDKRRHDLAQHHRRDRPRSDGRGRDRAVRLVFAAAGALGVFVLPWFVPFRQPINSLSYTYGFNNTAAWVAVAVLLAILCLMRVARRAAAAGTSVDRILSGLLTSSDTSPDSVLRTSFIAVAALGALLQLLCYTLLPSNDFGEVNQHTARLDLMLLGQRPYTDFHYNFGPGMLDAAYGLYRLGARVFSIDAAYCATLMAAWVLGTYLAYYVVSRLGGSFRKTPVFLCVSLLFLSPTMMAYQYTAVRYFMPLASLLFVHRAVARASFGTAMMAAIALPLAALAFSPDAGIVTTAALVTYFTALVRSPRRGYAAGAVVCALSAGVGLISFGHAYLDSIRSYSSAVSAFPVFPTLTVIALLTAAFVIVPALGGLGFRERTPLGALAAGMAIALALQIPPALGRCDLMHVAWNGVGVMTIALAALTTAPASRLVSRTALWGYVILFPLAALTAMTWHSYGGAALHFFRGDLGRAEPRAAPESSVQAAGSPGTSDRVVSIPADSPYGKTRHFSSDLQALLRFRKVGLPFGADEEVRRFLKLTGRFVPEYWPETFTYLGNEADIARKLRDLEAMDVILVPREIYIVDNFITLPVGPGLQFPAGVDPALHRATAERVLTSLTLFPVWLPPARNPPLLPEVRVMAEIGRRYIAIGQFREFLIAKKRGSPSALAR